jgi:hypothetical protein
VVSPGSIAGAFLLPVVQVYKCMYSLKTLDIYTDFVYNIVTKRDKPNTRRREMKNQLKVKKFHGHEILPVRNENPSYVNRAIGITWAIVDSDGFVIVTKNKHGNEIFEIYSYKDAAQSRLDYMVSQVIM